MGKKVKDLFEKFDTTPTTVGDMVRAFRKGLGFTLEDVSDLTGIQITNLSNIENDKVDLGVKRARLLAAALGVRPQDILFPFEQEKDKEIISIEKKSEKLAAILRAQI